MSAYEPLIDAIEQEKWEVVRTLSEDLRLRYNTKDATQECIRRDSLAGIKYLLDKYHICFKTIDYFCQVIVFESGALVNFIAGSRHFSEEDIRRAIECAIQTNNVRIFQTVYSMREAPLLFVLPCAARLGKACIVDYLCEEQEPCMDYKEGIRIAIMNGYIAIAKRILCVLEPSVSINDLFVEFAASYGHTLKVFHQWRAELGLDTEKFQDLAFQTAASQNNVAGLTILYEVFKVNPGANDNMALRCAARYGNDNSVRYLCNLKDERIDPSVNDNEVLKASMHHKKKAIFKFLCQDRRVNPLESDLHYAIELGNEYYVNYLTPLLKQQPSSQLDKTVVDLTM